MDPSDFASGLGPEAISFSSSMVNKVSSCFRFSAPFEPRTRFGSCVH